jgi:hypothetical protein
VTETSVNDNGGRRLIPARLSAFGAQPTRALMTVVELSPAARLGRGAMALGACWGLAAVAVFLPILHLILVPTLVGGGMVAAIVLGRQHRRVTDVRGTCPRCLTEQQFEASGRVRRVLLIACPRCHTNVTLLVGEEAAGEAVAIATGTRT